MKKKVIRHNVSIEDFVNTSELHPILKKVYANRNIKNQNELTKELKDLLSYQQLSDIDKASECLFDAIKNNNKIVIVGDYDVDGATSIALLMRGLKLVGAKHVDFIVPNRFIYGYGLSKEIVDNAIKLNVEIIITVDNGIASNDGIDYANSLGIKVVVTDHHLPGKILPNAYAIINPNQPNDLFESKNLAGVGVAFYLLLALRATMRKNNWFSDVAIKDPNLANLLDLVAFGTVADVSTMDKNNRILVHQGLIRIRSENCCEGIKALIKISKRNMEKLSASDLAFALSPRLNAAGRLDDMTIGVNCLLSDNANEAYSFAIRLNSLNEERKKIESDMRIEAFNEISNIDFSNTEANYSVCLINDSWHQGITGIVASRLKEKFNRPVIIFAPQDKEKIKGSARSIDGLHIRNVLEHIAINHPNLLEKYGGHAQAAGITILRKEYEFFSAVFEETAKQFMNPADLQGILRSDGELTATDISPELAKLLETIEPWGKGFEEPTFDGIFNLLDQRIIGKKHLKLTLSHDKKILDAIMFNADTSAWPNHRCNKIMLVYKLNLNKYGQRESVQIIVEYLEPVYD